MMNGAAQVGRSSGRVRLRPNRGFPRRTRLQREPCKPESTTIGSAISLRQKMADPRTRILFGQREMIK